MSVPATGHDQVPSTGFPDVGPLDVIERRHRYLPGRDTGTKWAAVLGVLLAVAGAGAAVWYFVIRPDPEIARVEAEYSEVATS
jgi:hypothetical protein